MAGQGFTDITVYFSGQEETNGKALNVLLVGEGNFSFSRSLCDAKCGNYHITATCYESEDTVSRLPLAWDNVQHLRDRGAIVHFSVDATRLKDSVLYANKPYNRVIFNFPHCGRKAGVKKNRDLLTKFFQSCVDVLSQKGDIHVALCKGQGGTPADRPMREWHNSWQVVAMAAKAGFILNAIVPFAFDEYCGYKSTGYRSQEKSFHVEGSLNHIFTRGLLQDNMTPLKLISKLTDTLPTIQTPEEHESEASRCALEREKCHPTKILYEELLTCFEKSLTLRRLNDTFPLFCEVSSVPASSLCSESMSDLYYIITKDTEISSRHSPHLEEKGLCSHQQDKMEDHHSGNSDCIEKRSKPCYLRSSLTHFTSKIIEKPDFTPSTVYTISGPVFRKCLVSRWTMPVYNEALFLWGSCIDKETDHLQLLMDTIQNAVTSLITSISTEATSSENTERETDKINKKSLTFHHVPSAENYKINISWNHNDQIIGTIMTLTPRQISNETGLLLVTLNLDIMAMYLLDIPDWRILWTPDERFIQQYNSHQLRTFQSFSLHPPYYNHDVSFWVGKGSVFDNLEFHTIAQRVSKGCITDIQLLDQFHNVQTDQTSLCYRITYQSPDRALSYEVASEMQLLLRQELQRLLCVTIR
ncbi:ferredoxin-fold anticodon-binding domain-containing protein 1 [Rhinophrynus dorsalis]